jgi:small-conductance mechanosensitive channel
MLAIWDRFKDANIDIPFPQRDVHISGFSPSMLAELKKTVIPSNSNPG